VAPAVLRERFGFALCRDRPRSTAAFETAGLVGRLRFIDPD
jgi:hypothetical protein